MQGTVLPSQKEATLSEELEHDRLCRRQGAWKRRSGRKKLSWRENFLFRNFAKFDFAGQLCVIKTHIKPFFYNSNQNPRKEQKLFAGARPEFVFFPQILSKRF